METGHPLTRAVNSGSGNRALLKGSEICHFDSVSHESRMASTCKTAPGAVFFVRKNKPDPFHGQMVY